ncbi:alpha/beta fold hydrolase [Pedobacter mucosus]|uniref:alpha/beta fold hydrolase n=1 Tax=Pedobacter mucosus TaxID=2895286 RepID=UPI001EE49059|nr:alpha/beta hydrolase [Pedobacter mucosus]UKT65382.1 alpha/beta hydrolase [Pedobacter mucosus]
METNSLKKEQKTLVFLHYFGGSAASWHWVKNLLQKEYQCFALDFPGCGGTESGANPSIKSMADFVRTHLKSLNIKSCILIGHSMGGKIALQVAIDDADNNIIDQLILVAPSPPSIEEMPEKQKATLREPQDESEAEKNVKDATVKILGEAQYKTAIETQLMVRLSVRKWWVDEGVNDSIADKSKRLKLPITVIASKTDPAITYQMTNQETMPNLPSHAILVSTTNVGHLLPLEDPLYLAETIQKILTS